MALSRNPAKLAEQENKPTRGTVSDNAIYPEYSRRNNTQSRFLAPRR